MNNNLSLASIIEKNKLYSQVPLLVCLEIDVKTLEGTFVETIYLVNNDENVTHRGNVYTALYFDVAIKAETGSIPEISLNLKDVTGAIKQKSEVYGGGVGFDVRVMTINADRPDESPMTLDYLKVVGARNEDYVSIWKLGAEDHLSMVYPARRQLKNRCSWVYKSAECGYTGALTSCDYSLKGDNGCAVHQNVVNYGGFPGVTGSNTRYV